MSRSDKAFAVAFILVIAFFCCSIAVRTFTRQVLVKRLGMSNAFTSAVLFDVQNLDDGDAGAGFVDIDWAELYPFSEDVRRQKEAERQDEVKRRGDGTTPLAVYESHVKAAETAIEVYSSDYLVGHTAMLEASYAYEATVCWDYVSYGEYNGVVETADGYLTAVQSRLDMREQADSVVELAEGCESFGVSFLYVNVPCKVCEYEDPSLSGVSDYSNQNSDELLELLSERDVDICDLREAIHEEGLSHHGLFFRTDHHWLPTTGLWAAGKLAAELNARFGHQLDVSMLNRDRFDTKVYPEWFLGSQGKKVTLARAEPEDFELLYPTFVSYLRYQIPSRSIDMIGDFSILYDMQQVEERDYYSKNPYAAYIYANQPLEVIENLNIDGESHVLVVHDSFGNCVVPFLSLVAGRVDSIDLRHFDGSLQAYIEEERPDMVVVMYSADIFEHEVGFDLR